MSGFLWCFAVLLPGCPLHANISLVMKCWNSEASGCKALVAPKGS
ncbi:hypothetical protein COLO4_37036 [Corchorus olitorius]|uniref:Uncharacterized protein n=1 Tax=Corchorus olitorius TaxID=93759 RepID=A0A1R3G3V9_9ROSI|nr:hypothetical protein COLO4_37036 [Corchorus olitorius]